AAPRIQCIYFPVTARTARTQDFEIALSPSDGRAHVFTEVKARRARGPKAGSGSHEQPLNALRPSQQARVRRLALAWLSDESRVRPTARAIRFDAIGVTVDWRDRLIRLDHLEAAW